MGARRAGPELAERDPQRRRIKFVFEQRATREMALQSKASPPNETKFDPSARRNAAHRLCAPNSLGTHPAPGSESAATAAQLEKKRGQSTPTPANRFASRAD